MLRRFVGVFICLCLLMSACEKKEPGEPSPRPKRAGEAPEGMVPIRAGAAVFISNQPVTVGEYVEYLQDTGQPVPLRWQGVQPGVPEAETPVTGLTRSDAGLYAAWSMNRLPEPDEWQAAAAVVASRPYPWADDGAPVPAAAVFLVRDWQPGSKGEHEARQRKVDLPVRILSSYEETVADLRERIEELARQESARATEQWQQLKPALFNLLEKRKELAELTTRRERRAEVLEILKRILLDKGKMAAALKIQDLSPEEAEKAVQAYDRKLSDILADIQQVRRKLEENTKKLQEQVVALTGKFEESGALQLDLLSETAQAVLDESAKTAQDIQQALDWKGKLESILESLGTRAPAFEAMPTLDDLRAGAEQIAEKIRQLGEDETIAAQIEDIRARIRSVGETIQREFLKENLVVEELSGLVNLRARKEAIEATLNALKEALGEESESEDQ